MGKKLFFINQTFILTFAKEVQKNPFSESDLHGSPYFINFFIVLKIKFLRHFSEVKFENMLKFLVNNQ